MASKSVSYKNYLSNLGEHKKFAKSLGAVRSLILQSPAFKEHKEELRVLKASKVNNETGKKVYEAINLVVRYTEKDGVKRYNTHWTMLGVRKHIALLTKIAGTSDTERQSAMLKLKQLIKEKAEAKAAKKGAKASKKAA